MVAETLIEKIASLPPDRLTEVEDFVDFLRMRDQQRRFAVAAAATSTASFARIWNNPEDDVYDAL